MFAHGIQVLVAQDLAGLIGDDTFLTELIVGAEAVLVYQFHDGEQFFQFVLERSARQRYGIAGIDTPGGDGYLGVPVFQPLHLIHDHHVGLEFPQIFHIIRHGIIGNHLIAGMLLVQLFALYGIAFNHQDIGSGKTLYLPLPLVFQRGGTHHQYLVDKPVGPEHFGRGYGLYGLSQSHLVGNEYPSLPDSKSHSLLLIGKQFHAEQGVEDGI